MNFKLNKDIGEQLLSGNIKYKDYKNYTTQINNRVNYIINEIAKTVGYTVTYWNYDNSSSEYDDEQEFDIDKYSSDTSLNIESNIKNEQFRKYYYKFPSKWLFEDFEAILFEEYQLFENKKLELLNKSKIDEENTKKKNNLINKKLDEMKKSIFAKLTLEEILYVSISKPTMNFKNNNEELSKLKYVATQILKDFNFSNFNNTKDAMLAIKEKVNATFEDVEYRQLILSYIGSNYNDYKVRHISDLPININNKTSRIKI